MLNRKAKKEQWPKGTHPQYQGQVLTDPSHLSDVTDAWHDLHSAAQGAPFSDIEWLTAWASVFWDSSVSGYIALVWHDDMLVAALPMRLETTRVSRRVPVQTLALQMLYDDRVGYHDILIRPGHEAAAEVLFELCLKSGARYMDLTPLAGSSGLDALRTAAEPRWQHCRVEIQTAIADIQDGWDAFLAARSRNTRKTSRQLMRKVEKAGMRITSATFEDDTATEAIEAAYTVSSHSWKAKQGSDIGTQETDRAFFRALFDGLRTTTQMHLHTIWDQDRPAASSVALRARGVNYGLVTDYDAKYAEYALGRRAILHEIEQSCAMGDVKVDHLRATPFTRTLSDDTADMHRLRIALRPGFARWIISAEFGIRAIVERFFGKKERTTGRLKFTEQAK